MSEDLERRRAEFRRRAAALTDDARVRSALANELPVDTLSESEAELFYDLMPLMGPSPEAIEYFRKLGHRGGGVGYDSHGRLVRGLPGGGVVVLKDA